MSLKVALHVLAIFILSAQEVRGQTDWGVTYSSHQICASKGSTVDIPCTYTYPPRIDELDTKVEEALWFTKLNGNQSVDLRSDPDYSGRVEYLFKQNDCTLRVKDLRETDSAEYKFMFTTNQQNGSVPASSGVNLTVTVFQVVVESVSTEADLRCHSSCNLSDNPSYVWYKDGKKMNEQTYSLRVSDFGRSYSCAVRGHEDKRSAAVLIQGWRVTYSFHQICVLKGSTVDIPCTYTYPSLINHQTTEVMNSLWIAHSDKNGPVDLRSDPNYSGRVEYLFTQNDCTLRIKDLRETDSAEYKFMFTTNQQGGSVPGSPGVILNVADLSVQVGSVSTKAELRCHCSCNVVDNPSYVWYKNGEKLNKKTSSLSVPVHVSRYYCAIKGHEDYPSPAVLIQDWGVTYSSHQICATKGSTVDIPCTYTYPLTINYQPNVVTQRFWYINLVRKEPVDLRTKSEYSGRVEYHFNESNCTLRIKDLRESDSAKYMFRFTTNQRGGKFTGSAGVTLTVTDLQLQVKRSSTQAELTCRSRCNRADNPSYLWFINGKAVYKDTSSLRVSVNAFSNYSCAIKGHEDVSSQTIYPPELPFVSVSPVVEGRSVNLNCSSDANPVAKYAWYKEEGKDNQKRLKHGPQLDFKSIKISDSGEYYCRVENELGWRNFHVPINVKYGPKACSVSISPSGEIKENKSVTLTCSSDSYPAPEYTWYKINTQGHHSKGSELVFSSIQSSDTGRYYCEAKNELGLWKSKFTYIHVKYAPKPPSVSVTPSAEIMEGKPVILTCSSDANPAPTYTWYKENGSQPLTTSIEPYFRSIKASDSAEYYCLVENTLGNITSESISINVQYAPKPLNISMSPSGEVLEGKTVSLTCSSDANPPANYTWYKERDTTDLQSFSKGPQLVFRTIQSPDSGEYYCTAENKHGRIASEHISLDVKYAPKLPSVSVSPSGEIVEGRSVTLTCSSDANPAANYTWYKKRGSLGNQPLTSASQLLFRSIKASDSGEYYCTVKNKLGSRTSGSTIFDVKYAPKSLSVLVSPFGEILEGRAVSLTCTSDANPVANYTWYKKMGQKDLELNTSMPKLVFGSVHSSDTGRYYCAAKNKLGRRTSGISYVNVKYAPKPPSVSVIPSGEIIEGKSIFLTCSSDANPAPTYTWYKKNGNPGHQPLTTRIQPYFGSIKASDFGEYYCVVVNTLGNRTSESISINVKYAPKIPSVSVSPPGEIVEGSSVNLTCSSDANPAANYTWYKMEESDLLLMRKGPQLVFSSIQSSDSKEYNCRAMNNLGWMRSKNIFIDVKYAPKFSSVSVSPGSEVVEGSSVTLTCSSDANPTANYTWYKEGEDSPKAFGEIFTISDFRAEHSGNYYCEAQNTRGRHYSPMHVIVVAGHWTIKRNTFRLVVSFLVLILLLLLILWKSGYNVLSSKKITLSSIICSINEPAEMVELDSDPGYQNVLAVPAAQTEDAEEQEDMV